METTPNLGLPYIMAAQAQKHVTHNEAIRTLDALVQLAVLDRDLAAPPASPGDGDRYIVAAVPSGLWAGRAGQIAAYQDGAWAFFTPREGWLVWVADEDGLVAWDGAGWLAAGGGGSVNPTPLVGVNATADTTNRLAVKSPATLLDNVGAGHQLKLNKAASADTASLLMQTAYSGRAEMGLTGDDDFHVKVSADGTAWHEAIVVDRSTGAVAFPSSSLNADWSATSGATQILNKPTLGTAAARNTGTSANNVVLLDGAGRLPAVDGSQLLNLPGGGGGGSAGAVNPNLVINGDFQINQRDFAGGALASGVYGHDRWKASGATDYSVAGYVVTLTSGTLFQLVEPAVFGVVSFAGQQITVSVDSPSADLTIMLSGNATNQTGTITAGSGRRSVTLTMAAGDSGNLWVRISKATAGSVTFGRVKVEVGSTATAWQPRPLTEEQRLCQRYFYRRRKLNAWDTLGFLSAFSANAMWGKLFDLPVPMRATPTVTVDLAHIKAYVASSTAFTGGGIGASTVSVGVTGGLNVAGGLSAGQCVMIYFENSLDGFLDVSAEI